MNETKSLFIYYTADRKVFQVVRPTEQFNGGWGGLVEGITMSDHARGVKNYHSFEIK